VVFTANWVVGQPSLLIREVMSKPVLTAPAGLTPADAYRLFREHAIRHLVVLGAGGGLYGIFTLTDLVKVLRRSGFPDCCTVSALMTRRVLRVEPRVTARHALSLMASHAISGIVVAEASRPVGVFSERDVVRLLSSGDDLATLPVASVMSSPVITIESTAPPSRALELMQKHAVRRLVVTDEHGAMAGILTQTDLSRIFEGGGPFHYESSALFAAAAGGHRLQQGVH
jgi:CBS domain-containing protein